MSKEPKRVDVRIEICEEQSIIIESAYYPLFALGKTLEPRQRVALSATIWHMYGEGAPNPQTLALRLMLTAAALLTTTAEDAEALPEMKGSTAMDLGTIIEAPASWRANRGEL